MPQEPLPQELECLQAAQRLAQEQLEQVPQVWAPRWFPSQGLLPEPQAWAVQLPEPEEL